MTREPLSPAGVTPDAEYNTADSSVPCSTFIAALVRSLSLLIKVPLWRFSAWHWLAKAAR